MTGVVNLLNNGDRFNVDIDVNVDEHDCVEGHVIGMVAFRSDSF